MNSAFWNGRRVLLTGHTGFKGSWLALWLKHLGAEVTGFALPPPAGPNLFEIAKLGELLRSVLGDIGDYDLLHDTIRRAKPEVVIHMAAQSLVRRSYADPIETYRTNVMGTVHLLEAVRRSPSVRAVVNVTSDKSYQNREWDWGYREVDRLGGHDPYSNSKACSELVTAAFRDSYFGQPISAGHHVGVATARAGNVIGGGDWAVDRLVPDILRAVIDGEAVHIRSPNAIRPWQHVLEPLSGYLTLAERLYTQGHAYDGAWNFGPADDDAQPVSWIVEQLTQMWSPPGKWVLSEDQHLHEAHYLRLDCSKARQHLGWRSRWDLREALERIVAWHRAHLAGEDMQVHSIGDIEAFTNAGAKQNESSPWVS